MTSRAYVGEVDGATGRCDVWIETSGSAGRRALQHTPIHSNEGFEWGYSGSGPADLAEMILRTELGLDVPRTVYLRFRDDVVAKLPRPGFRLEAAEVMDWARVNRTLIDAEIFGVEPPRPALSVVPDTPDVEGDADSPEGELPGPTASALVSACEAAWDDIRTRHSELPAVVVVLGSGVERGRLVKLGHWWSGRWVADGQVRGEVLLAGEALHLTSAQVFEVLLHEAAHGINATRGVKDTSRGGRYHNQHFADTARTIGLKVSAMPPYGLARTELTAEAETDYAPTIARLGEAMRIARQLHGARVGRNGTEIEGTSGTERDGLDREERSKGSVGASCECGRRLRMAPSVLARGPVVCGACGTEFTTGAEVARDQAANDDRVVDSSFIARRRAALDAPRRETLAALEQQRDRLGSALALWSGDVPPPFQPLRDRYERLAAAIRSLGGQPRSDFGNPSSDQRAALVELANAREIDARFAAWYERFGTADERAMQAHGHADAASLVAVARASLAADGTLSGPAVDLGGFEVRCGDRVVVARATPDGPAVGTEGTVHSVDAVGRSCRVDFAIWGDVDVHVASDIARSLTYDYIALEGASVTATATDAHLEIERATILEPELPF